MNYHEIIEKVSNELNLSKEIVNKVYKAYWLSIRNLISDLPLKEDLNEEEFSKLRTNYNIPSLGKLNCTFDRYNRMRKRLFLIRKLKENAKDKED